MCDLDDSDILNEIQALESVLNKPFAEKKEVDKNELFIDNDIFEIFNNEQKETPQYHELLTVKLDAQEILSQQGISEERDIKEEVLNEHKVQSEHDGAASKENALELNKSLLQNLYKAKKKVLSLIKECDQKIQQIECRLQQHCSHNSKVIFTTAGMPYFKLKDGFAAPQNDIAKTKTIRKEIHVAHLRRPHRWTSKDRNILLQAIKEEIIIAMMDKIGNKKDKDECDASSLPSNVWETIGPLGAREFDWLKIAANNLGGRHSAEECRVLWNVYLHPAINKSRWAKGEDNELKNIAKDNNLQDWDKVALELNTRRSGYQCFVRYNTINTGIQERKSAVWSNEEDEKLCYLIGHLRIGNFIPWGEVTNCMCNRTKQQIYCRWMFSLSPHLKKGRFTEDEDKMLLEAVWTYGPNFAKISAMIMPHRSTAQLSNRYMTLNIKYKKYWTLQEDIRLLELYSEFGCNWSKIAEYFPYKNRVQLRHRHSALLKYKSKGIPLSKLPRRNFIKCLKNTYKQSLPGNEHGDNEDVDELLVDHFFFEPSLEKTGRKQICFQSEEMAFNAMKELYEVLQILRADLNIPHDLTNVKFSDQEKEVLNLLKIYWKIQNDTDRKDKLVEEISQKMFSFNKDVEKNSHYVPSIPPTGHVRNKKSCSTLVTAGIDYPLNYTRKFCFYMPIPLVTPEIILTFLGDDELQFKKFSNFYSSESTKSVEKRSAVRKTYIILPKPLNAVQSGNNAEKSNSLTLTCNVTSDENTSIILQQFSGEASMVQNVETTLTPQSSGNEINVENSSTDSIHFDRDEKDEIKPSLLTVNMFKRLQTSQIIYEEYLKRNNTSQVIPKHCAKARNLLKERLRKLFRYPIVMNRVYIADVSPESLAETEELPSNKRKEETESNVPYKRIRTSEEEKIQMEVDDFREQHQ